MTDTAIPIINFEKCGLLLPNDDDVDKAEMEKVGEQLYDAFSTFGFAYISNVGIKRKKIDDVNDVAEKFFSLAEDEKKTYGKKCYVFGYQSRRASTPITGQMDENHEGFRISGVALDDENTIWPDLPGFKQKQVEFMNNSKVLLLRVLRALGLGMGLKDPSYFCKCHENLNHAGNHSCLRTIFYPSIRNDYSLEQDEIRFKEHTDYGALTLLFQDDIGGLQVENPEGKFVDATPIPGTVVLNVGDASQFWSGGRLKSTVHRVVAPSDPSKRARPRRTIAYFGKPDDDVVLEEMEFQDSDQNPKMENKSHITSLEYQLYRFTHGPSRIKKMLVTK